MHGKVEICGVNTAKLKVLKDVPNTGDSMPVGGTAMMILLGMGALLFLGITERKRRRNR